MSMIRCDLCENLIDSDADPACFVEGNPSGCFCRSCRDQAEEEVERKPRPMPSNIDAMIVEAIAADALDARAALTAALTHKGE